MRSSEIVRAADSSTQQALVLTWETPNNMPFRMPIDVEVSGKTQRVEMKNGRVNVPFTGADPVVDPSGWVLKTQ